MRHGYRKRDPLPECGMRTSYMLDAHGAEIEAYWQGLRGCLLKSMQKLR